MSDFQAGDDVIDVRDVIARVEELREELIDSINHKNSPEADQWEELDKLESLISDLCGNGGDEQWEGDWYPVTLIHESYFEASMDEMIAGCYEIPKDLPSFMTIVLDYDALKQDYTTCEFGGETYYYR